MSCLWLRKRRKETVAEDKRVERRPLFFMCFFLVRPDNRESHAKVAKWQSGKQHENVSGRRIFRTECIANR